MDFQAHTSVSGGNDAASCIPHGLWPCQYHLATVLLFSVRIQHSANLLTMTSFPSGSEPALFGRPSAFSCRIASRRRTRIFLPFAGTVPATKATRPMTKIRDSFMRSDPTPCIPLRFRTPKAHRSSNSTVHRTSSNFPSTLARGNSSSPDMYTNIYYFPSE